MRRLVLMIGLLVAAAGPLAAQERTVRRLLADATVRLASGCTGAIAERSQLIVTAYHCVTDRGSVGARLATGEERTAWVVATDQVADQAVLFLEESSEVTPLRIGRRREIPGAVLYFAGHPDRVAFQSARLDRIGVCPSLPGLPNALFTSIKGTPGDSGAALVNAAGDLVGLVHGGARCEIATPADTLLALVQRVLRPAPAPHVEHASIEPGAGVRSSSGPQAPGRFAQAHEPMALDDVISRRRCAGEVVADAR
jgi:S1-C subfamily serine protease